MRSSVKYFFTLFILLCIFSGKAQDTLSGKAFVPEYDKNTRYEFLSVFDKKYTGKVIEETPEYITIFDAPNNMKYLLPKKEIKEVEILDITMAPTNTLQPAKDTSNKTSFVPQFEKGKYYEITMVYGTKYRCEVNEEAQTTIELRDKRTNTKHTLLKSEIKEVKTVNARALPASRFDDDYYSNFYMLSENALPFKEGCMSSTTHYFVQNYNYSFNEHWGVSVNAFFLLPISVGVKCSYEISKDLYVGANAYVFAVPVDSGGYQVPLIGGIARVTKGDNNKNFTLGIGGAMVKDDDVHRAARKSDYAKIYYLNFGFANRFAKRWIFNIENFLFPQAFTSPRGSINLNLTGISFKWASGHNTHWNFGCYGLYLGDLTKLNTNSTVIPLPYISFARFIR